MEIVPSSSPETETVSEPTPEVEEEPASEPAQEIKEEEKPVSEKETAKPAVEPASEPTKPVAAEQPATTPAPASSVMEGIDNIAAFYGQEMADKMRLDVVRKAYYILDNDDLTNEELIAEIEKLPTYNRSVEELGELKERFKK